MDINKVKDFFKEDRFCIRNGIEIIEANENYAICKAEIQDYHLNANNGVQGGMMFTLADFTFAVAANCLGRKTVSQTLTINYLKVSKGKTLFAKATPVHIGKRTVVYSVSVYDDNNEEIAFVTANGFVVGDNPTIKAE